MRLIIIIIVLVLMSSCKSTVNLKSIQEIEKLSKQIEKNPQDIIAISDGVKRSHKAVSQDVQNIQAIFKELDSVIEQIWGKKHKELPTNKRYVKYSNDYQARAIVDFEKGWVKVETIATKDIKQKLTSAVFETLLTSDDPATNDIFNSTKPTLSGEPFLYPQVRDHDGELVRYKWRAERYASHLVNHQLKTQYQDNRKFSFVTFNLVSDHKHLRHLKYSEYVLAASKRYQISPALIYAVIETESSFNPYAVSHANAYGLMQVVPATAGKDVYALEKGRNDQPSKTTLMQPKHNIDIGTAYLKILNTRYLVGITNSKSREYSIISAYNGGAGNVFKTYHTNRTTALKKINAQSANTVYSQLRHQHPRAESRRYLEKVTKAKSKYL